MSFKPVQLIVLLWFAQLISASAQSPYPKGFPTFREVEREFFKSNHTGPRFADVQKKPEGYYVVLKSQTDLKSTEPVLFWSAQKRTYLPLDFSDGWNWSAQTAFHSASSARDYDLQPYYGYAGWYRDAIAYLERIPNPNDDELYALGRAYFFSGLVLTRQQSTNFQGADSVDAVKYDLENPRMSHAVAQQYAERVLKSGAIHKKLMARNPDYPTIVGPIDTEYANNLMHLYLWQSALYDEQKARAYLPEGLYRPMIRQSSYNLLQSCPPNAILMTYGDTDTYPLLYLQVKEGVRTDVLVVNISLLVSPYYNRHLRRDTVFDALPPLRSLPQEFYDQNPVLYHYSSSIIETPVDTLGISELFSALVAGTGREESAAYGVTYNILLNYLTIPVDALPGSDKMRLPASLEQKGYSDTLYIALNRYSLPDLMTELDWVLSNGWARPLCFSVTCRNETLAPLGAHLVQEGLVFRLYPVKPQKWSYFSKEQAINEEETWRLYREVFQWPTDESVHPNDCLPFFHVTRATTILLAQKMVRNGDNRRARIVLDDFCRAFPDSRDAWDSGWLYVAQSYAIAGDKEAADRVIDNILDNYDSFRLDQEERLFLVNQKGFLWQIITENDLQQSRKRYSRTFTN
ncbi:MAG: hypothetical protein IT259_04835 [Saprospiraceae bacterium]|nr:hypothetical protein [Saprospiraceae bacterium]